MQLRSLSLLAATASLLCTLSIGARDAAACSPPASAPGGFSNLNVMVKDHVPRDAGLLVAGVASGIEESRIASALTLVLKAGDRTIPATTRLLTPTSRDARFGTVSFILHVAPAEALEPGTQLTLQVSSSETLAAPAPALSATIGSERLADLDLGAATLDVSQPEQIDDRTQTATCTLAHPTGPSGPGRCTEDSGQTELNYMPRFKWAKRFSVDAKMKWSADSLAAYTQIDVSLPSSGEKVQYPTPLTTSATGHLCTGLTLRLVTDGSFTRTREICTDVEDRAAPTSAEQDAYDAKARGSLECSSIRYTDTTTGTSTVETPGESSGGCSTTGSHTPSRAPLAAFVALACAALAAARRSRLSGARTSRSAT